MVALGLSAAALTSPGPGELLEAAVKLLHLPARARGGLDQLLGQGEGEVVGNDPFHVTVWGDHPE